MSGIRQAHARTGTTGSHPAEDDTFRARAADPALAAHALADPATADQAGITALGSLAGNAALTGLLHGAAGTPGPVVQREEAWGAEYKTRRARPGALTFEEYKAAIGRGGEADAYAPPVKDASQWGGHRVDPIALSDTELGQILLPEKADDAGPLKDRIATYLPHINTAFEMMGIDTVEAQADYLAHTAGESGELAKLSEDIDTERPYGEFIGRGPVQVTWESGYVQTLAYLEARADDLARLFLQPGDAPIPVAAPKAAGQGNWRTRTPKWLTAYIASLPSGSSPGTQEAVDAAAKADGGQADDADADAGMPKAEVSPEAAARVAAEDEKMRGQITLMREAVAAIKKDPGAAADPKYAFLFSAAYMHWTKGVKGSGSIGGGGTKDAPAATAAWTGAGAEDRWVTGRATPWPEENSSRDLVSVHERAAVKKATYERGVKVLSARMVRDEATGSGG